MSPEQELATFLRENPHLLKDQFELDQATKGMGSGEKSIYILRVMLHNLRDIQAELLMLLERMNDKG